MVSTELRRWGLSLFNYIDDFSGVAHSRSIADSHFTQLQCLLAKLDLLEAHHKSSQPSQVMMWLGFMFGMVAMIVNLPPEKECS